jgi:hypothetical protein
MFTDVLIRVDPADGTPDGSRARIFKRMKPALKHAVKLVSANAGGVGAQASVWTWGGLSLTVFRNDGDWDVQADFIDDDGNIQMFDLSDVT